MSLLMKEKKFPENVVRNWFKQIIVLLKGMNEESVYHRDLKPENFLLDENYDIVLTDFGSATTQKKSKKKVGTTLYMSPELYNGIEYDCLLNDVYCSAIIAFALLTGLYPEDQRSPFFHLFGMEQDLTTFWQSADIEVSSEFKDFFERILCP